MDHHLDNLNPELKAKVVSAIEEAAAKNVGVSLSPKLRASHLSTRKIQTELAIKHGPTFKHHNYQQEESAQAQEEVVDNGESNATDGLDNFLNSTKKTSEVDMEIMDFFENS